LASLAPLSCLAALAASNASNATGAANASAHSFRGAVKDGADRLANATAGAARAVADTASNATAGFSADGFGWGGYFQAIGMVFLLLAVLAVGFYLLKRFGSRTGLGYFSRGDLKMEAQLPLGQRRSVVVVRFLNKRLVLGVTDENINLLTELDAGNEQRNDDFTDHLEEARSRRGSR
jgi:flagellar protein FliO/FliZ